MLAQNQIPPSASASFCMLSDPLPQPPFAYTEMRRANSCSRSSKRKRSDALLDVPSVGMRLCVGDRAIPTERKTPL